MSAKATETPEDLTAKDAKDATEAEPTGNEQDFAVPQHWPARYRDALSKAPEDVRIAWQDHAKTLIGEATKAKQASAEYERVFTPEWKEWIRGQGHPNEASFTGELLSLYSTANQNPGQFVRMQASKAGLTPEQYIGEVAKAAGVNISGADNNEQSQDYVDPEIHNLRQHYDQHISRLEQQVKDLGGYVSSQRQQSIDSVIDGFVNAKDDQGKPRYPHFQTVESDIASLLASNPDLMRQKSHDPGGALSKAYDMAVRLNPQTFEALVSEREQRARSTAEAERAKRARSSFNDAMPAKPQQQKQSLDDMISNAMGTGA